MSRFFICDMGFDPWGEGSYVPALVYHANLSFNGSPPSDPETGIPYHDWGVYEVTMGDITPLLSDARLDALPAGVIATPVAQLDPAQVDSLRAALDRRGIGSGIISQAQTLGEILAAIQLRAESPGVTPTSAQAAL